MRTSRAETYECDFNPIDEVQSHLEEVDDGQEDENGILENFEPKFFEISNNLLRDSQESKIIFSIISIYASFGNLLQIRIQALFANHFREDFID